MRRGGKTKVPRGKQAEGRRDGGGKRERGDETQTAVFWFVLYPAGNGTKTNIDRSAPNPTNDEGALSECNPNGKKFRICPATRGMANIVVVGEDAEASGYRRIKKMVEPGTGDLQTGKRTSGKSAG